MARVNNVDVGSLQRFAEQVKSDPAAAKRVKSVTGRWCFEQGKPQFVAEVQYPGGQTTIESDFAPFMGGGGLKPDPIAYCLYGFAACFAGTYAAVAAEQGVALERLEVTIQNELDLTRSLGLGTGPATQGMKASLTVESDAAPEKLEDLRRLAEERCPGVYCITNPIPFESAIAAA